MTRREKQELQKQLLALSKRVRGQLPTLENAALRQAGGQASGNLSNVPLHMADLGSDAFEQTVSLSLLENDHQRLEEISAALDRLKNGNYGRCEECGDSIAIERLRAVPYARLCIDCARRAEQTLPGRSA